MFSIHWVGLLVEPQDDADVGTDVDNTRKPPTVTLLYIQGTSETIKRVLDV